MRQNGLRMVNKYNGRRSHGWVPAPVCNTRVTKIFKYLHGEVANSEYEVRPAASLSAVAGPLLDAFNAAIDPSDGSDVGGDGGRDESGDGEGDSDDGDGDEGREGNGESAASVERKIARSIFRSIHDKEKESGA